MRATHDRLNIALPSDDAALGPNDRLRLYIPTKVTTLSMGWRTPAGITITNGSTISAKVGPATLRGAADGWQIG